MKNKKQKQKQEYVPDNFLRVLDYRNPIEQEIEALQSSWLLFDDNTTQTFALEKILRALDNNQGLWVSTSNNDRIKSFRVTPTKLVANQQDFSFSLATTGETYQLTNKIGETDQVSLGPDFPFSVEVSNWSDLFTPEFLQTKLLINRLKQEVSFIKKTFEATGERSRICRGEQSPRQKPSGEHVTYLFEVNPVDSLPQSEFLPKNYLGYSKEPSQFFKASLAQARLYSRCVEYKICFAEDFKSFFNLLPERKIKRTVWKFLQMTLDYEEVPVEVLIREKPIFFDEMT